ncbi:hypothetical protein L5515_008427 [Caenorhabditis briggsae]|uniref:Carboxylesterase type B domain-containing protein n=1 Tax=Caenorhabditis briggsae TaxID=6238 RepID=A0AAE9JLK8_CAEBR|nr:hypothetical protein L5515_008427 [Caenorhabditis briggsae]
MGGFLSHLKPEINSEILEATCGPIRGYVYKHKNKIVDGYLGIPFAKAPKRFEKPVEAETWTEVKYCTKYGPGCPQGGVFEQMKDQLGLSFDEIFGCSAGGVCADLLTLSTRSRDLFQKCIAMSGSADCEMACRSKANQALIFKEFAIENGCSQTDSSNLMKWYQEQSIELLNKLSTFKFSPSGFMSCGPNADGDFFTESLDELRKTAPKKNFIFGRTEFEGLIMAVPDPIYSRIGDSIEASSKKLFKLDVVPDPEDVHEKLENWYSEGIDKSDVAAVRKRFIEFLGDAVFNVGILNSAQAASKSGNHVFLYSFDYSSSHGNDFRYIFGSGGYDTFVPTENDFQMMESMATWFSNFSNYGNPNGNDVVGKWKNYTIELPGYYFKIDYLTSRIEDDILNNRLKKMGGHLSHLKRERNQEVFNSPCGPIRGNIYRHGDKIVNGYLGIPYAAPPIGDLRFKKPEPGDNWNEIKDCTEYGPRSPQSGPFAESIRFEKEDVADEANCLTLNVFAPTWESEEFKEKRPVMVYIHGGAALVDILSLSPHSRDLFQRVIVMSGGALCEYAVRTAESEGDVSNFDDVRKKMFDFYTRGVEQSNEKKLKERIVELFADALFTAGIFENAQNCAKYGNDVWLYVFDYSEPSGFGPQREFASFVGATHATDLRYILGEGFYSEFKPTDDEIKMIDKITEIYSNFGKYGNPNETGSQEWERYNPEHQRRHYRISYPRGNMRDEYCPERMEYLKESAGGVSVNLLSLSPHSRDLFHKFLPMSGSAHVPFAIRTAKYQLEVSLEYARNKGFTGSGSTELFEFMNNLPVEKLLERSGFEHSASGMVSFGPNLDYDFFPKPLEELRIEASNKPVMIGMAEHEGLLFAFTDPHFTTADEVLKRKIAAEFKEDVVDNPEEIRRDIFEYYMNFNGDSDEKKLVAYTGDSIFNAGVILAAKSLATRGNTVFFYVFDYCNPDGFGPIGGILPFRVPTHCTKLRYIVGEGVYSKFEPNETDLKMMEYMTTMFSNFAKYGNPNISGSTKWESFRASDNHKHFYITRMGGYLSHLEAEPLPNVLDASCGPIKGNSYRHGDKTVNGYLGIPYAQPPIGPLRFSKPLPADIWTDTRDCTQYGPRCPPSGFGHEKGLLVTPDVPDEANCLSLNVFVPGCESEEYKDKRPVMVYVHGGGFEVSSSREFCAYSMSSTLPLKDVILVTMNYRLGILGFFTTGDAVCPGNWGLWDQTLALKWVKKHIASFGGDPNNVTLFGQSAGGACVDLLTLSPHSRDLFQKIVPMSGSALKDASKRTMMTGIAGNEGILFAFTQLSEPHSNYSELLKNWIALDYKEDNMDNLESVRKEIFEYYTKNIPKDEDTMMRRTAEYVGDSLFHTGQLATAESAAKYGDDVWFYKFDFCNPNGFGAVKDALPYVAPTHGIELRYLFGDGIFSKFEPTEEELKMLDRFTTMFANFAKYGNPNETGSSKWEKYDPSRPGRHFRISYPDCEMVDEYCGGNWKFLEEIRKKNKCFQANVYGKKI